jgi:hypothetical protein
MAFSKRKVTGFVLRPDHDEGPQPHRFVSAADYGLESGQCASPAESGQSGRPTRGKPNSDAPTGPLGQPGDPNSRVID